MIYKANKKPIVNRILLSLTLLSGVFEVQAASLEEVVSAFQKSSWITGQTERRRKLQNAVKVDVPKNEWEFAFSRETQPGSVTEDFVTIGREFQSPWLKGVYRGQAFIESELEQLEFEEFVKVRELEIHKEYFDSLKLQIEVRLREGYLKTLSGLIQKLSYRAKQGVGAAFDYRRLSQQRILEEQRLRTLKNKLRASLSNLALISYASEAIEEVEGNLLPDFSKGQNSLDENLKIKRARIELKQFEYSEKEWSKKLFKEFSLEIGSKRIDEPGSNGSGMIFGFSVPVQIEDAHKAKRRKYQLLVENQEAQVEQLQTTISKKINSLTKLLEQTVQQSSELESTLVKPAYELNQIKQKAYQNGRGTVVDLLDTRTHLLESHLQVYKVQYIARQTWLEIKGLQTGVRQ